MWWGRAGGLTLWTTRGPRCSAVIHLLTLSGHQPVNGKKYIFLDFVTRCWQPCSVAAREAADAICWDQHAPDWRVLTPEACWLTAKWKKRHMMHYNIWYGSNNPAWLFSSTPTSFSFINSLIETQRGKGKKTQPLLLHQSSSGWGSDWLGKLSPEDTGIPHRSAYVMESRGLLVGSGGWTPAHTQTQGDPVQDEGTRPRVDQEPFHVRASGPRRHFLLQFAYEHFNDPPISPPPSCRLWHCKPGLMGMNHFFILQKD